MKGVMSRKPVPAQPGDRARLELAFDKPQLLGRLFGEYDQNLVAIENRLGVYIAARGNKVQIEGEASAAAKPSRNGPLSAADGLSFSTACARMLCCEITENSSPVM